MISQGPTKVFTALRVDGIVGKRSNNFLFLVLLGFIGADIAQQAGL